MEFPTRRSMRMMTSVSMLPRMIGAAIAFNLVNGLGTLALHGPHVGDGAGYRRRNRRGRACQMSPSPRSLAADKIAVGGGDRALAWSNGLAVGRQAHRTPRLAPFESGFDEDLVEPFGHGLPLDCLRARDHPGAHAGRNLAAACDRTPAPP